MKILEKLKTDRQDLIAKLCDNIASLERIAFDQQAENERLQKIIVGFMDEVGTWSNKYDVDISNIHKLPLLAKEDWNIKSKIKAEAIKEFAERLKEGKQYSVERHENVVPVAAIDWIVREMVGE